jgi:hypothetical protein
LNWIWSKVRSVFDASIAALSVHSPAGADSAQRIAPDWSPTLSTVIGLAAPRPGSPPGRSARRRTPRGRQRQHDSLEL